MQRIDNNNQGDHNYHELPQIALLKENKENKNISITKPRNKIREITTREQGQKEEPKCSNH